MTSRKLPWVSNETLDGWIAEQVKASGFGEIDYFNEEMSHGGWSKDVIGCGVCFPKGLWV